MTSTQTSVITHLLGHASEMLTNNEQLLSYAATTFMWPCTLTHYTQKTHKHTGGPQHRHQVPLRCSLELIFHLHSLLLPPSRRVRQTCPNLILPLLFIPAHSKALKLLNRHLLHPSPLLYQLSQRLPKKVCHKFSVITDLNFELALGPI
jgi:hypothetical protein